MSTLYTANAIVKASGATYRQIQYWTDRGYLKPVQINGLTKTGSGNPRIYDETEVYVASVLPFLLDPERIAGKVREACAGESVTLGGCLELRAVREVDPS